jgi:hypothetical protein
MLIQMNQHLLSLLLSYLNNFSQSLSFCHPVNNSCRPLYLERLFSIQQSPDSKYSIRLQASQHIRPLV